MRISCRVSRAGPAGVRSVRAGRGMRCCILFVASPLSQIVADSIMTTAFFDIQHGLILGVICFFGWGIQAAIWPPLPLLV